ncbi:RES family NAD+ phosphorylase [Luteibacter aegosomatissinici]|uniref:RES family NAD+ phosphorylase n=1 Tax=Luteibacter aegosomatissinici TaxID=2911539 RepID=UPI001FFB4891|nr:RES family NAD+ phosphorylase [Luteibacter aegosomatissinici]UPG95097.1 RES family NAD+ phosphorylase [Luteibacter aegosomatissinici]
MIIANVGAGSLLACYRVIAPRYATTPRSGMGAARKGGRFNRPGQEALYLALDEATALAEYKQDNPWLPPGTICTFFLNNMNLADLSAGYEAAHWPPLWADFAIDWRSEWFGSHVEPPTWYMSDDVVAAGLDGIIFPSQAHPGGRNLVVYRSSERPASDLQVYDPAGVLQTITL